MTWFERIKKFYDGGLWTKDMVKDGIEYNRITEEEYEIIVGESYSG